MRRGRGALLAVLAAGLYLIGMTALARAIDVQITTVRAAERGPTDAQLGAFRPRLRRLVGYRSFTVLHQERRPCVWRNREAFVIPGGRLLHVVPKGMRDQTVVMQVRLVEGSRALVDTDVRLQNRGVMLFGIDRDARAAGGALIIMLRAEE